MGWKCRYCTLADVSQVARGTTALENDISGQKKLGRR